MQRFAAPPNGNQPYPQGQMGQRPQGQGNMPFPYMNMGQPGQSGQPQPRPAAFPGNKTQPFINNATPNGNGVPRQPQQPGQPGQPMPAPRPSAPAILSAPSKQPPLNKTRGTGPLPSPMPNTPFPNGQNGQNDRLRVPNPPSGSLQLRQRNAVQQPPTPAPMPDPDMERVGNHLILYRSPNFFVRTAYRPQHLRNPLKTDLSPTLTPKVMPLQEQRIAASDTRFMPTVTPFNPEKKKRFPIPSWLEAFVIVIGLLATLVTHALNMFNFPRYELDEGTYMSNAWAVMNGLITPYAYGYGHPPVGWIQIAAWVQLTGGFFTFGNALNSGRVLMLFYALGCSLLVYLIVRRLGASRSAGLLAMVIFSLSPLSVTYQRQTLLDNIATFWLLLSLFLLVVGNSRLFYIAGAAIAFGISILSKEVFILFVPVMIYATWLHTTKFQRKFALVGFIYVAIAITSAFILMAILRGELLPQGWLPWDTHEHLSFIDTFIKQAGRGSVQGSFLQSWDTWWRTDTVLMFCSTVTVIFNLIVGWWNRKQLLVALMAVSFWILLIRGGVVFTFYLIPLIPLIAMNTAFAVNTILGWLSKVMHFDLVHFVLVLALIAAIVPYDIHASTQEFTQDSTIAQRQTMTWIRMHIPRTSFVVINSYLYMDMRQPGGTSVGDGAVFPFAHIYFNVATDPEISDRILNKQWDRIDYLVMDKEMSIDIESSPGSYKILTDALAHSFQVARFISPGKDIDITIYQVQHKFGPPVVMAPPKGNGGGTQIADRGTISVDRRTSLG